MRPGHPSPIGVALCDVQLFAGQRGCQPLTPAAAGCRPGACGSTTSVSATSSAPAVDRRPSRSTLAALAAPRQRHFDTTLCSDSSRAPLELRQERPDGLSRHSGPVWQSERNVRSLDGFRARSMRPASIHEICANSYKSRRARATRRGASPDKPGPNAWKPLPTRGRWSEPLPRDPR